MRGNISHACSCSCLACPTILVLALHSGVVVLGCKKKKSWWRNFKEFSKQVQTHFFDEAMFYVHAMFNVLIGMTQSDTRGFQF